LQTGVKSRSWDNHSKSILNVFRCNATFAIKCKKMCRYQWVTLVVEELSMDLMIYFPAYQQIPRNLLGRQGLKAAKLSADKCVYL